MEVEARLDEINGVLGYSNPEKFRCSKCKNYLSVSPIFAFEYSCGRCIDVIYEDNSNAKAERQTLYEEIAKQWRFPCCNKNEGCQEILKWSEVEEHEKNCQFDKIECIFNAEEFSETEHCIWKGTSGEYFKHLEEHAVTIDDIEKLKIWDNPKNQIFRIELFGNILLVFLSFLNNAYHFVIIGKEKREPVKYKFLISDGTGNSFHCSGLSMFLPVTSEEILEFELHFYPKFSESKYFSVKLSDQFRCACDAEKLPSCRYCSKMKIRDVFICKRNCKLCQDCFKYCEKQCRYCNNSGYKTQFFSQDKTREKLSNQHFYCSNSYCSFHGNFYEFQSHAEFCEFIHKDCKPISKLNSLYEMKEPKSPAEFFFMFDELIFKLSKTYSGVTVRLKLFSSESSEIKYKFEIVISNYFKLMSFAIFPNFDYYSQCDLDNLTVIPESVLKQYGNDDFELKVNILKI